MESAQLASYRSFDPIEHFRLKITLEKLSEKQGSLLNGTLPFLICEAGFSFETARESLAKRSKELQWQQKVYSPK